jgi:hypothetical protein
MAELDEISRCILIGYCINSWRPVLRWHIHDACIGDPTAMCRGPGVAK